MENNQQVWEHFCFSYDTYLRALREVLTSDINRVTILKGAFRDLNRRDALIHLLQYLKSDELQQLFDELVYLASFSHGRISYIREIIKKMPRAWVLEHIEKASEPHLVNGTYDEYRSLLQLYLELDKELTIKLAERAKLSADYDTREAGEEYVYKACKNQ
jgi:hypothetical protein